MKFIRTKKLVLFNNKGGVGKTTISYNIATLLAEMGYKTVLIDLDPQCNLSSLALGEDFSNNLLSPLHKNIYNVLSGIIKGGADIDLSVNFQKVGNSGNLHILPGSMLLSEYENVLSSSYNEATSGQERGFFVTSAIDRFLSYKGLKDEIDIFIIDTSPILGLLNKIIFLGSDYFVTPLMPDSFSVQGIENLGNMFESWKDNWKKTAKILAKDKAISHDKVLDGEGLFAGYIVNSYNQYGRKPIKNNEEWITKIPTFVKKYLSEKHSRNGLVEKSWRSCLGLIKDGGQLSPLSQIAHKAMFNLNPKTDNFEWAVGTEENLVQIKEEFQNLVNNLLEVLNKY
jgi:chromosome partitioning protein